MENGKLEKNNSQFSIHNSQLKNILWDFDGVIFDSMKIKSDGFLELFKEYDALSLEEMKRYHYAHGGVSRFDKIRYFYNNILGREITEDEVIALANKFAKIIEKKLFDKNNLIMDSIDFIKNNYNNYSFHIVSGAEHNELNRICDAFDLTKYFISIDGSPTKKDILVKNLLEKYNYIKDESILIGDAITDYNASIKNGIGFYGYNNIELKKFDYIESFKEFNL
jgi:phosphoglycolate phosphatase-like HAD superfamily hydrolase